MMGRHKVRYVRKIERDKRLNICALSRALANSGIGILTCGVS